MWHFRNDRKFRPKSTFTPRSKRTVIEIYISCVEERYYWALIFLLKDWIM